MTINVHLKPCDMNITQEGVTPFIPLNLNDVNKFRDCLTNYIISYIQSVNIENDKDAEIIWLSSTYFIKEMMGLFSSWYFVNQIEDKNYKISGSKFIESILNTTQIVNQPLQDFYLKGLPKSEIWKRNFRIIKSRLSKKSFPYCLPNMIKKDDIITFSRTRLIIENSKNISKNLVISKFNDWFSTGEWIHKANSGISEKSQNLIIDFLIKSFNDSGNKTVSKEIIEYGRYILFLITSRTNFFLNELKSKSKYLPNTLWISTAGLFYNRIMARVIMMNGGDVFGHDHGTGVGGGDTYTSNLVEFNYINNFVTYSPGMAEGYKKQLKHKSCLNPNCNILSISSSNNLNLNSFYKIKKNKPKSIMYLSNLYEGDAAHLIPAMSDYLQVDWQSNLFSFLYNNQFDIYFKPHPESHSLPSPMFEKLYNVKILKGMFHEFYNLADVIISDHPLSTAFIEALQYGIPTVLINLPIYNISEKGMKLLSKRCAVVNGRFDDKGRVDVNLNEVKKAITVSREIVGDNSFINYYFPYNVKI